MVYLLHYFFKRGGIRPEDQTDAFGTLKDSDNSEKPCGRQTA